MEGDNVSRDLGRRRVFEGGAHAAGVLEEGLWRLSGCPFWRERLFGRLGARSQEKRHKLKTEDY